MSASAGSPRRSWRALRPWRGLALLLGLAAATACDDPLRPVDDSMLSDSARALYRVDAARLAVRALQGQLAPAAQDVELPASLMEPLYAALVRVYSQHSSARDDVVDRYRVHTFLNPDVNRLVICTDTTARWADGWRAGQRTTGTPAVDALVNGYGLTVDEYRRLSGLGWDMFLLRSGEPLNTLALADRFRQAAAVLFAEPDSWIGGGRDIVAKRQGGAWRLDYSVSWGDCMAGCINGHFWTFVVSDGGSVTFLGQRGPTPPPGS